MKIMLFQYRFFNMANFVGHKVRFAWNLLTNQHTSNPKQIDGTALVQINHPKSSLKTFGSYCEAQLVNKVNFFCQNANRIDIVFNVYQENSLRNDTRESRGSGEGTRTLVQNGTPIQHKKFKDFLRVNNNKIELCSNLQM